MHRITKAFEKQTAAFMPFVTAGLPNPETFGDVLTVLDEGGADIIEIGLPFSDPIADGPTIQAASAAALEMGVSTRKTLELIRAKTPSLRAPVVLMTYINPILAMGVAQFAAAAKQAGVAAVIVPDLPKEEAGAWKEAAGKEGLGTVFLITPVTPEDRVRDISALSDGFLYYVNLTGVTGSGIVNPGEVAKRIARVKEISKVPVAAGFGISTPAMAVEIAAHADGIIIGSYFVKLIMTTPSAEVLDALAKEVAAFREALDQMGGTNDRSAR